MASMTPPHFLDYQKAISEHATNSDEFYEHPKVLLWVLGLALIGAFVMGFLGGAGSFRPVTCWEIIAILVTFFFAMAYGWDLWNHTAEHSVIFRHLGRHLIVVTLGMVIVLVFLIAACTFIILSEIQEVNQSHIDWWYFGYLLSVAVSFFGFTFLDAFFAHGARGFKKVREYWALCIFVDAPTSFAFFIILLYLGVTRAGGNPVSKEVLSGAVVMQMLIADTLYLIVVSNFHFNCLARFCDGVNKP